MEGLADKADNLLSSLNMYKFMIEMWSTLCFLHDENHGLNLMINV